MPKMVFIDKLRSIFERVTNFYLISKEMTDDQCNLDILIYNYRRRINVHQPYKSHKIVIKIAVQKRLSHVFFGSTVNGDE